MLASSPSIFSSTTISLPLSPNAPPSSISRAAATASSREAGITTPLPAASPLAFMTVSNGALLIYFSAASGSVKFAPSAVGIEYFFKKFLEYALLASSIAPFFDGP